MITIIPTVGLIFFFANVSVWLFFDTDQSPLLRRKLLLLLTQRECWRKEQFSLRVILFTGARKCIIVKTQSNTLPRQRGAKTKTSHFQKPLNNESVCFCSNPSKEVHSEQERWQRLNNIFLVENVTNAQPTTNDRPHLLSVHNNPACTVMPIVSVLRLWEKLTP